MRENNLIIICATIIICIALIAGTFIVLSTNNNNANSNSPGIIDNMLGSVSSDDNSANENTANPDSGSGNDYVDKINWATFYADGNPNTGEAVTVNVGSQHAGKSISLSMDYYRDGYRLISEPYKSYTVDNEGNIYVPDTASMAKYPDKCTLSVSYAGHTTSATCNLEKRKGSQTAYF